MKCIMNAAQPDVTLGQLGGKANALATLVQYNFPVPAWFVLSPLAFESSLTPQQREQLQAGDFTNALRDLQLNEAAQKELMAALTRLCPNGGRVAVRSSAVDEDGTAHSFAGQLESFLGVPLDQVATRIADVWRSGFGDRLLAYRQENQLTDLPSPPAVLIQRMVNADVAGVAFSANPVTGQRGVAVISAVYGLGTALVAGEVDADTFQVDRRGQVIHRYLAQKTVAHRLIEQDGTGLVAAVSVADDLVNEPTLSDEQVQAIARLVRQVEQRFERPQDIEWAIEKGELYLLQARPITTLVKVADPDGALTLWDNSNIVESYGGVTTPLTFSFARRAYEEVYRQFCRMMGVSKGAIADHDVTFRRMLGLIQGRIYYNLLSWYRVLALLPGFTVNRRFMEQMMGVREELPADVLATLTSASLTDKLRDSLRLVNSVVGLIRNLITLPRQIRRFYQRLDRALSLPPAQLSSMRPDELAAYYHLLEQQLLTRWDAPLINDFFAMIFYGVLRKLAIAWCHDTAGTLQNDLISGEGGMISAEPAERVRQMAATVSTDPIFVDLLCNGSLPQILQHIPTLPAFHQQYEAYLAKFGDRCLEELKLESQTLHDNPLLLLRSIGNLAASANSDSDSVQTQLIASLLSDSDSVQTPFIAPLPSDSLSLRQQAELIVAQSLQKNPLKRWLFNWVLSHTRLRVRDRENLRFERTRLFGRVRRLFVELGRRFFALDQLTSPQDIFYLNVEEVLGFIDGTTTCTDLKGLVNLRQAEFERYRRQSAPPDRFQTRGTTHPFILHLSPSVSQFATVSATDTMSLQGMGCCPGIVRASVQVITDPRTAELRKGSILVAERTDPGWIMLFPAAAGLLVERGSLLSHSAIVAREMGIPAIVSLAGVTQWLKDGDWVEMDGSTGVVRRLEVVHSPIKSEEATPEASTPVVFEPVETLPLEVVPLEANPIKANPVEANPVETSYGQ
ncbi:MAG: PEP/pyruvate-binding domain-containing protein [Oculatellaceae cyanobacterium bins.114]|nr:PEP/pyruvate-binding domain-containing protein [Oculatellaceae cyanobacterium bins.114]